MEMENDKKTRENSDFFPLYPRPFIAGLPTRIDEYEEDVARFFHSKTGLDYYTAIDQVVDLVVNEGRTKVVDLLADTAAFALRIADRRDFHGHVYSHESNVTLLERAKQRAAQLNLQKIIDFTQIRQETRLTLPDCFAEIAVSIFDIHRYPARPYLAEIMRILAYEGIFITAAMTERKASAPRKLWHWVHKKCILKSPAESDTAYSGREELIESLFHAGFRQVILQEKNLTTAARPGVFNLIAAMK